MVGERRPYRRRRQPAWIGGVFLPPGLTPITRAIRLSAKATCENCDEEFELNLVGTSVEPNPTPDSDPARAKFSFPTECPTCGLLIQDVEYGDEDGST